MLTPSRSRLQCALVLVLAAGLGLSCSPDDGTITFHNNGFVIINELFVTTNPSAPGRNLLEGGNSLNIDEEFTKSFPPDNYTILAYWVNGAEVQLSISLGDGATEYVSLTPP